MADAPNVSIVIPFWRGEGVIGPCLDALSATIDRSAAVRSEIIIAANSPAPTSTPDHPFPLNRPSFTLIQNEENLGFAGGCNVGMAQARGDLLILLNQDALVAEDWLGTVTEGMGQIGSGVAGCLIRSQDGRIEHAGGAVRWPLGLTHHLGQGERLGGRWRQPPDPDFVTGAAMVIHRSVYKKIGPLDEAFWPGYYEDVDYCLRASGAGFPVTLLPQARLTHTPHSAFGEGLTARWARLRGRLRFLLKHQPPEAFLAEFLPAERTYRASVLDGDSAGWVARAYVEAAAMVPDLWQNRATPPQIRDAVDGLSRLYADQPWQLPMPFSAPLTAMPNLTAMPDLTPLLTDSPLEKVPVIGPVWRRLRHALHRLIIFYVLRRTRQIEAQLLQQDNTSMQSASMLLKDEER